MSLFEQRQRARLNGDGQRNPGRPAQMPQEGRPSQMPQPGRPAQMPQEGRPSQMPQPGRPAEMPQEGRPALAPGEQMVYLGDPLIDKHIHDFIG